MESPCTRLGMGLPAARSRPCRSGTTGKCAGETLSRFTCALQHSAILMTRLLIALLASCAATQATEIFGNAGWIRVSDKEGVIGDAATFGAGAALPINSNLVIEVEAQTHKVQRSLFPQDASEQLVQVRRTLLLGSILYRWGGERSYVLAGGGFGSGLKKSSVRYTISSPFFDVPGGIHESSELNREPLHVSPKAGFVCYFTRRIGARASFFAAGRSLAGTIGLTFRID